MLLPWIGALATCSSGLTLLWKIWKTLKRLADNIVTKPQLDAAVEASNEHQTSVVAELRAKMDADALQIKTDLSEAVKKANDLQLKRIARTASAAHPRRHRRSQAAADSQAKAARGMNERYRAQ